MTALLAIEDLSVDYVSHGEWTPALRRFSLAIEPGEMVGLAGPSGSGKSTVALAVLRLIRSGEGRIASGRIVYKGRDLLALPEPEMRAIRGREIAMIFQDPFTSLNPVLTVRAQLEETARAHGLPIAGVHKALEQVQLEPGRTLAAYPHQLSGGQRQRVMIAMALVGEPGVILADEPTTALDVLVQKDILELMSQLQKDKRVAMLLITHHRALLSRYASRVVLIPGRTP